METEEIISKYNEDIKTPTRMVNKAMEGLPSEAIQDFFTISGVSQSFVGDVLEITTKTLNKKIKEQTNLSKIQSEKILKLIKLYELGIMVFGNTDAFNIWLSKPSYGLENKVPNCLLKLVIGIDLVYEELNRIAYGDFA